MDPSQSVCSSKNVVLGLFKPTADTAYLLGSKSGPDSILRSVFEDAIYISVNKARLPCETEAPSSILASW